MEIGIDSFASAMYGKVISPRITLILRTIALAEFLPFKPTKATVSRLPMIP